ncbi:MAG: AbrB/MazE/SpoVT family DNA-binding domain-containing protein [Caulobacteraceae bacterium]|nr:AbrB/MazE/SpoVT family DNA-binding domain-containing protein [Caulobacteraceae bacterium]
MSEVKIGRWGKNLAVRLPHDLARSAGVMDGERVDLETRDGDIVIHRSHAKRRVQLDAQAAMAEILAESRKYSLGGIGIRHLIDEGRR